MSDNNHIPTTDQKLAQDVGKLLEEDRSLLSLDDPLIDQIVDHKRGLYSTFEDEIFESRQTSWANISPSIQKNRPEKNYYPKEKSSGYILVGHQAKFLKAAAAVFLVILLSTFFYLQFDVNQSEIVAQSGATQTVYTLNDDSQVLLRPNSMLSIIERSDNVVRYKLEGEAFFNITKDKNRQFLVDAGVGHIEVTGTSFNIREWGGETVVYLEEGSLTLHSSNKTKEVFLKPNEAATVTSASNISDPIQTDGTEFTSWQTDEIIFNNRTAVSIIKEIEYHYSIDIQVPERIESEVLGGTLSLESRAVSLENLGIVLGGKFSSIKEDTYQFVE